MRPVAVVGTGHTRFGELWEYSLRNLVTEAGMKAILDCRLSGEEIDALYVGTMSSGQFVSQELIAPMVLDEAGMADFHIPTTHVEGAGASGAMAFRQAFLAVASGLVDVAIAGGVEKTTDVPDREVSRILGAASDQEWEAFLGATDPALHALIARAHMERFGTTREQLASVSVKNHRNGALNPDAQFQKEVTMEAVVSSGLVADPLRVLDMAAVCDGGAACVLVPLEDAASFNAKPVEVLSSAQGSDYLSLAARQDITHFAATRYAAQRAFDQAGLGPADVDVAEVHDAYTINEIIALEDLGFCEPGQGGPFVESGKADRDGEIAINPSGGLKARGHALGATGIAQLVELVAHLRATAGKRQVKDAQVGLAHSTGGTGVVSVVNLLGVPR
jgi:acetyl-CoA C-acetyltransferase